MGRQGPCFHCGIKQTPLWRLGPPEKPVLCNACGSRWRIRGTLDDYLPKHGGGNTKHPPYSKGKEAISQQSSASFEDPTNERVFDSLRESEWIPKIHKRKRSELQQNILTPIGRLHRQLLEFLHEDKCSKSHTIEESPLIYYNSNWMMDPNETRLGAILLDPPQKTEKAEASSDKNNLPK